jgi:hypothetical protein
MALIKRERMINDSDIISHVFMSALSGMGTKESGEIIESWRDKEGNLPDQYSVSLTVNGTELNIEAFFNNIWGQYSNQVESHAKQIVLDQTSDALNELIGKISEAKQAIEYAVENINWDLDLNKQNQERTRTLEEVKALFNKFYATDFIDPGVTGEMFNEWLKDNL